MLVGREGARARPFPLEPKFADGFSISVFAKLTIFVFLGSFFAEVMVLLAQSI